MDKVNPEKREVLVVFFWIVRKLVTHMILVQRNSINTSPRYFRQMANVDQLEQICQKVMNLDPKMRSARIITSKGHLAAGGMKGELKSLEDSKQDEMLFMELALRVRMRHEFDTAFGAVHFSLSYREKVIVMSFPLAKDDVLLASSEKDLDFGKIPFKILEIIKDLRNPIVSTF